MEPGLAARLREPLSSPGKETTRQRPERYVLVTTSSRATCRAMRMADETDFRLGDETDRIDAAVATVGQQVKAVESALLRLRSTLRWLVFFAALVFLAQVPSCVNTLLAAAHLAHIATELQGVHLGGG